MLTEISKPTLLLDENKCRQNIERMAAKASHHGLSFRPHFKTHQSAGIGNWIRDQGVEKITVSSPMEYPQNVKVGVDGLIVERGFNKGLLLPQVPIEFAWNSEEFLCNCCMKAGLMPDCWLFKDTKIFKFSCIILKELAPKGRIVINDIRK